MPAPTFVYQPNAFTGMVPYMPGTFVRDAIIDINGDGLKDIVFQFMPNLTNPTVTTTGHEAVNSLAIFINVGGQHFEDRTATYLIGPTNIGGLAADQIVLDLNGDGRDDIVYATNQEDNRISDNWPDFYGPLSILLSGANSYSIVQSSAQDWWHGINYGVINGKAYLVASGSPNSDQGTAYVFKDGALVESDLHYPYGYGNPAGFIAAQPGADTRFLIQENRLLGFGIMQGWTLDSGGTWQSNGTFDVLGSQPFIKTVQFQTWNGASTTAADVYLVNGRYVMKQWGGLDFIGRMSLTQGAPEIAVFIEYQRYIRDFDPNLDTVISQDRTGTIEVLRAFTIQNNQLLPIDLHIQGQVTENHEPRGDILDFNGDGYQDLVVRPYNQTGLPVVYLNDTHGGFFNMNLTVGNPFDYGRADAASSIVADFNNDGIMDVVTLPANSSGLPYNSSYQAMADYRLYLGQPVTHDTRSDINNDRRSDIIVRDAVSGWLTDWLGQPNGSLASNSSNVSIQFPSDWRVAGSGDYNGDGRDDLLLRSDAGWLTNWLGTASGGLSNNGANTSLFFEPEWKVAGNGDINGDGKADLLLRRDDGWLTNWLGTASGNFANNGANPSLFFTPDWKIVSTGDFNGDGYTDILLRRDDGWVTNWTGNASGGFTNNGANTALFFTTDWKVIGTGDVNGDGKDDLILRRDDGWITDWLGTANGSFTNNGANTALFLTTDWKVSSIADINGDGREDLLLRNDSGWITDWLGTHTGSFANNGASFSTFIAPNWVVQDAFM